MKAKLQKTWSPTPDAIDRSWYVVDAEGVPLGRISSEIAQLLRGKHKPTFAPHMDMGDYVIVINAEKVAVTGTKETDKVYYRHSGYPGGIRAETVETVRDLGREDRTAPSFRSTWRSRTRARATTVTQAVPSPARVT